MGWEGNRRRAQLWAGEMVDGPAAIIEAEIRLGICLDPTIDHQELFPKVYAKLATAYATRGWTLPTNRGRDCRLRDLDCLIINEFLRLMANRSGPSRIDFQTVRCPFEEGEPIFPHSMIRGRSHIQISVRDNRCLRVQNIANWNGK